MILFDIGADTTIDLEKVESIILDKSTGLPMLLCVLSSGTQYIIAENRATEFFSKLNQIEKGDGLSKQYVSI